MKDLCEVKNFGAIAAEADDIKRFFVQTPVYDDVESGTRQVVIGRKGAGKTALYLALIERTDDRKFFARGLAFRDYPWALHARYAHPAMTRYERFLASWKFLTFMEIFKVLLTEDARPGRYASDAKKALASIEKFIQKNWGAIAFDYRKTFPSGGFKFDGISFEPQAFGFGLGSVEVKKDANLSQTLERLNEWLWNALVAIGRTAPKVYVLFDELDSGYDPSSDDYIDRVVGLLLACRRLAKDFSEARLPFSAVAFLRSDIFDALHFGDKNKLTDSNVTFLSWTADLNYLGCSLKQLLDHRIRESFDIADNVKDPWSKAFDGDLMRGTQHKFHHMTFRSYLRPRDIIKFANCALDEAKQRVLSAGGRSGLISNADITDGRKTYSRYLLSELDDEIAAAEPKWSEYVEILRRLQATRFTRDAFEAAYEDVKRLGISPDLSTDELLVFFYRYSIVGFERDAGAAGLEIHFRYLDETIRFNPKSNSFMVHRGLKEALELRDAGDAIEHIE